MSCDYAVTAACCPASVAGIAFESLHRVPNKKTRPNQTKGPKVLKKLSEGELPDHTKGITSNRKIMSVESSVTEGGLLQSLDGSFPAGSLRELRTP